MSTYPKTNIQASKQLKYKYQVLVDELREAKSEEYKTSIMAFINCLIISASNIRERNEIRSELIGLNMLEIVGSIRSESSGGDLSIQCDVFEEQRNADESSSDVNSHQDIFYKNLQKK